MPRHLHPTWILAAGCLALTAAPALGNVLIDEFTHVGIYTNPWPYVQTGPGMYVNFELVSDGTIAGENGRVRESCIHTTLFANPGVDVARMGVNTDTQVFEYEATDGVGNILEFSYGYIVANCLHADFSADRGLRIDFTQLDFGVEPFFRLQGRLIAAASPHPHALSPEYSLTTAGPQSAFIPFEDFENIEQIDLSDVGGLEIDLYAPPGTDFIIERIIAARSTPGDANGDGTVDVLDILEVLTAWGACPACMADFNDDGVVNVQDLLIVLANWT